MINGDPHNTTKLLVISQHEYDILVITGGQGGGKSVNNKDIIGMR